MKVNPSVVLDEHETKELWYLLKSEINSDHAVSNIVRAMYYRLRPYFEVAL